MSRPGRRSAAEGSGDAAAGAERRPPEPPSQCAALPYRTTVDGTVEVLLVTPRGGAGWIIPKGKVEPELGPCESARREAREEAGVDGEMGPAVFDQYRHGRDDDGPLVAVFLMRVTRQMRWWPEDHQRDRAWVPIDSAAGRVVHPGLARVLREAGARLAHDPVSAAAGPAPPSPGGRRGRRALLRLVLALLAAIAVLGLGATLLGERAHDRSGDCARRAERGCGMRIRPTRSAASDRHAPPAGGAILRIGV